MNYTFIIFVLFAVSILFSLFFTVRQQTAVSIERFGKFQSIRHSGLQLKIPVIDKIAARISLKIQQLDVVVETKTLDDVFVKIKVSVQFVVIKDKVYDAIYKLEYPHDQITSYVFDVVRAEVPKMKLDDVFVKKDDIAIAVKREVQESMETYGYDIIKTLVTDIDPDAQVKAAMRQSVRKLLLSMKEMHNVFLLLRKPKQKLKASDYKGKELQISEEKSLVGS